MAQEYTTGAADGVACRQIEPAKAGLNSRASGGIRGRGGYWAACAGGTEASPNAGYPVAMNRNDPTMATISGMSGEHEKDRPAIRHEYERLGAREFYARHGSDYRNPHEAQIRAALHQAVREWSLDLSHVLDLAAGSGEVTLALRELGAGRIDAIDPFTIAAYAARTGRTAERHTFEQIAQGALSGKSWRLIVCSFALHLVEPS